MAAFFLPYGHKSTENWQNIQLNLFYQTETNKYGFNNITLVKHIPTPD